MKPRYPVPPETLALQAKASDPRHSAWVSANAGSGKTHVLSQRVMRLLLEDVDPSRVLCLTYTRAAAANMSNRVFGNLAEWTMLGDAELAKKIEDVDGSPPDAERLRRARQLFARALDTPGGLKIQTIHAFCESVLHQFPLEANVAAHFEMLDPLMEEALFGEARREMLTGAASDHPGLGEAFAAVLQRGGEAGLDALLKEIVRNRDGLRDFIDAERDPDGSFPGLFAEFDFAPEDTAESLASAAWPLPGFDRAYFARFADACRHAKAARATDGILSQAEAGMAEADPVRRLELLSAGFLKQDGSPYSSTWVFSKPLLALLPDLPERYAAACDALMAARDRLALFRMLEGTVAALTVADFMIARYEHLKAARGFLDFNDLITRTVRLLARRDVGPWVQYKLDKGIDHILLDEAQDTSPLQWEVVKRLALEFFSGLGARDNVHRTVFAVGDEKQSIYSFQGAAPESFGRTGHEFRQTIEAARRGFERVELKLSFRSTEDVLGAVDLVFDSPETRRGLNSEGDRVEHKAIRVGAPGHVEVWPAIGAESVDEPDDWTQAIDHASAPAVRLAESIALTVRRWIDDGEMIEGQGRRLTPGDVLVLVRKRGAFVNALSRALKRRGIAVAGADRLSLTGHIAVKDMMALGRCLIQPEDDLSLAAVLRSPIFGFSDEALFDIAHDRGPARSLMAALREHGGTDVACRLAAESLARWASEAAFLRPFEFYSGLLGRDGVRARMAARLGQDAADILDEFLNFCLAQERTGAPGLEAFLATLEDAAPEIKREMDQRRDEVRIMTVHAAKGLEAPVVFLVDSGSDPFSTQHLPRLLPFSRRGDPHGPKGYLWRAPGGETAAVVRQEEARLGEQADDEYRRLLYVGMTRAEDRLILCGYYGKRKPKPATWLSIVTRALTGAKGCEEAPHPAGEGAIMRFRLTARQAAATASAPDRSDGVPTPSPALPAFLRERLPPVSELPRPLAPSGAAALLLEAGEAVIDGRSPVLDGRDEPGFAIQRGLVLHRMLQMLPGLPASDRAAAAARYLERAASAWPPHERDEAARAVMGILDAPDFAPLFAPSSRAEVAVAGHVVVRGQTRLVSGKIDRLAVTDEAVLLVDYKTNRPAPTTLVEVPDAYVVQLALYRAVLGPLYPGRRIEAALLFTQAPNLISIPASIMDEALVRLGRA